MQGKLPEEIKPKHPEKELNGMDLAHMRTTDAKIEELIRWRQNVHT